MEETALVENESESSRAGLRRLLDQVEDASPVQAVEAVAREVASVLGAISVSFLMMDLSGRALVRLTQVSLADQEANIASPRNPRKGGDIGVRREARELATTVPFEGGPLGQALRTQAVQVLPPADMRLGADPEDWWTVVAPVTERGEVLGLLELFLPARPGPELIAEIARTAHLLGFVVVASRRHTDLYEWGQRSTPFSLSAEIQRRLLPDAYTCEADSFTLSAWLEPADDVGGDTYDYSLDRNVLHLSMTDAMGHGVASSLTATLCVGSLRNARRHGMSLLEQADFTNTAVFDHATSVASEGFSTGFLGRVDLSTAVLSMVNAGHVAPYLLRGGAVQVVNLPRDLPFGLFSDTTYSATDLTLQPGDRFVIVTDGMLERNASDVDLPSLITRTADLHPREATRALADMILDATGHALTDDATLLVLDWTGHHGQGRDTIAGAPTPAANGG